MWPGWESDVEALKAGTFSLDAYELILESRGKPQRIYRGGGSLRHVSGEMEFTLVDPDYRMLAEETGPIFLPRVGRWLNESDFYDLQLRDSRGRRWTARNIRFNTTQNLTHGGIVIRGRIRQLDYRSTESLGSSERMWLYFPGDFDIPLIEMTRTLISRGDATIQSFKRDAWRVEDDQLSFVFVKGDGGVDVEVTARSSFPAGFDTRIEEALWFVLARPVRWALIQVATPSENRFSVLPTTGPGPQSRIRPPIELNREPKSDEQVGNLFLRYLHFVATEGEEGMYHPASARLPLMMRASSATIDEETLALCVAIESVVRHWFLDRGKPPTEEVEALRALEAYTEEWEAPADLLELLGQWEGLEDLQRRVVNFLGSWRGPNARTALSRMAENGELLWSQVKAWERRRHRAVHGFALVEGDDRQQLQDLADDCDLMHQLLLFLVFHLIGYAGVFTDRTEEGWPDRRFPPQVGPTD